MLSKPCRGRLTFMAADRDAGCGRRILDRACASTAFRHPYAWHRRDFTHDYRPDLGYCGGKRRSCRSPHNDHGRGFYRCECERNAIGKSPLTQDSRQIDTTGFFRRMPGGCGLPDAQNLDIENLGLSIGRPNWPPPFCCPGHWQDSTPQRSMPCKRRQRKPRRVENQALLA